jgi:hypothetical protein
LLCPRPGTRRRCSDRAARADVAYRADGQAVPGRNGGAGRCAAGPAPGSLGCRAVGIDLARAVGGPLPASGTRRRSPGDPTPGDPSGFLRARTKCTARDAAWRPSGACEGGRDAGRGDNVCKREPRRRLPGQLTRARRAGQAGEHVRYRAHLFRGIGGQTLPRSGGRPAATRPARGLAGGGRRPRHLTGISARPARAVTPARSAGLLPTMRATSWVVRPATTRSRMISA